MQIDDGTEWLETDGLGGFTCGTASGIRTRRYHALLLPAVTPPTGRIVLVNGVDAWLETRAGAFALSSQRYAPGVVHPDGARRIVAFRREPWPTWEFEAEDGTRIRHEIFVPHGTPSVVLSWTVLKAAGPVTLRARPFLSGRDYHALHHENGAFRFEQLLPSGDGTTAVAFAVAFAPYDGLPAARFDTNGAYRHAPLWYRNFRYDAERERGLDDTEDLATPGEFVWELPNGGEAVCIATATSQPGGKGFANTSAVEWARRLRLAESERRASFPGALDRAADAYLVRRRKGRTIVAGYPWFTDWGRDTFIALRGLCFATRRLAEARDILLEWAAAISEGMLPNRFPDGDEAPEFNSVDASLWYVIAVADFRLRAESVPRLLSTRAARTLRRAVQRIVAGYARGTRFGIRMDDDGLLCAGVPGVQLTWMDARVGDRVITPRIGKPVEVQALWLNALAAAAPDEPRWGEAFERGRASFLARFWSDANGYLADVIDVDHVRGTRDDTLRPNQLLAIGGLPMAIVDGVPARRIVDVVERRLLTPIGVRSLAPGEAAYRGRYEGGPSARDGSYHQGTVWPWLMGAFVDAWVRTRGSTEAARAEARLRFLQPLLDHVEAAGVGHVSEIADAEAPFTPRGCPFQAWSLGELIRIDREILAGVPAASEAGAAREV